MIYSQKMGCRGIYAPIMEDQMENQNGNAMATGIAVCIVVFGDYMSYCQC